MQALGGSPFIWNDTAVYVHMASAPIWSRRFWAGQRPPLTALLIKLVGSADGFLAAQAVIAALCWGFLAFTVGRLVEPGWRRVAAVWSMLAVATAFPVTLWNRSVLSESFSMSLLALLFATLIWTARRWTWPRVSGVAAVCLCYAAVQGCADLDGRILVDCDRSMGGGRRSAPRSPMSPSAAGGLSICLIGLVALTGWGAVSSHRTRENVADVFYVRVFPFPDRVAWFAAHGMPEQNQVERLAGTTQTEPGTAKVVYVSPTDPAFRQLDGWLATNGSSTYFLWLLTHPGYVISEPFARPERAFNSAKGDLLFYAAPSNRMESPLTVAGVAICARVVGAGGSWR